MGSPAVGLLLCLACIASTSTGLSAGAMEQRPLVSREPADDDLEEIPETAESEIAGQVDPSEEADATDETVDSPTGMNEAASGAEKGADEAASEAAPVTDEEKGSDDGTEQEKKETGMAETATDEADQADAEQAEANPAATATGGGVGPGGEAEMEPSAGDATEAAAEDAPLPSFNELDVNGDGTLSLDEFLAYWRTMPRNIMEDMDEQMVDTEGKKVFDRLDVDGNEQLSEEEFAPMLDQSSFDGLMDEIKVDGAKVGPSEVDFPESEPPAYAANDGDEEDDEDEGDEKKDENDKKKERESALGPSWKPLQAPSRPSSKFEVSYGRATSFPGASSKALSSGYSSGSSSGIIGKEADKTGHMPGYSTDVGFVVGVLSSLLLMERGYRQYMMMNGLRTPVDPKADEAMLTGILGPTKKPVVKKVIKIRKIRKNIIPRIVPEDLDDVGDAEWMDKEMDINDDVYHELGLLASNDPDVCEFDEDLIDTSSVSALQKSMKHTTYGKLAVARNHHLEGEFDLFLEKAFDKVQHGDGKWEKELYKFSTVFGQCVDGEFMRIDKEQKWTAPKAQIEQSKLKPLQKEDENEGGNGDGDEDESEAELAGAEGELAGEGAEAELAGEGAEAELAGEGAEAELAGEGAEAELAGEGAEAELAGEGAEAELAGEGAEAEASDKDVTLPDTDSAKKS